MTQDGMHPRNGHFTSRTSSSRFIDHEDTFIDDDDLGEYSDVEKLVHDPSKERQERDFLNSQHPSPSPSVQDAFTFNTIHQTDSNWKTTSLDYFYLVLKPFIFVLFMIFWILKEPLIRFVTFLTIIVSTVIVDPLLWLWSILPNKRPTSLERKKSLAQWCTGILVAAGVVVAAQKYVSWDQFTLPTVPTMTTRCTSTNDLSSIYKQLNSIEQRLKEHASAMSALQSKNVANGGLIEKHKHSQEQAWLSIQEIKATLDEQQQQLNTRQTQLNEEIRRLFSEQLPNTILVHTDKSGSHLELSPQFYEFLKSPAFMEEFVKTNKKSIDDYLSGQMTHFFERHEKEGALISKETFMKLVTTDLLSLSHNNNNNNNNHESSSVSLKELIESVLRQYHQDVLNTPDFALASRGGRIMHSKTSPTYEDTPWYRQVRKAAGLNVHSHPPDMILVPRTHVGECWRMKGSEGFVRISLSEPIYMQSVTIEHPSSQVLLDEIHSAPKSIELYGIKDLQSDTLSLLGRVEYNAFDSNNNNVQTFSLNPHPPTEPVQAVLVKIKSNWGNDKYTDIYRIRIHGVPFDHVK